MVQLSNSRHHVSHASARPANRSQSVMRQFLESGVDFKWPEEAGECLGSHCNLHAGRIPLQWITKISDKKASIDIYTSGEQYAFKEAFAVKTIREKSNLVSKTRARNEVESMRDLRHPHIAALLGTYTHQDRLSILIFPAAPCDLHMFLKIISSDMKDSLRGRDLLQELTNQRSRAGTPESRSSTSSIRDRPGSPRSLIHSPGVSDSTVEQEDWPLRLALPAKVESLRGYFVCLSQALNYIHENDVRHKDIKPENILIDASGSVVLTDFGISRRFPKKTPHITNDKWEWTRKYASPEIMRGKKVPRDDPSDVFSLGCVFLEMASLILGRDLRTMTEHYATPVNNSSVLEDAYYCNLEKVYTWIELLARPKDLDPRSVPDMTEERIEGQDFVTDSGSTIIEALGTIRGMLDNEPSHRPPTKGLWQKFQLVSSQICRDCDPRLPHEMWKPNHRQKDAMESGTSRRRSMQSIPKKASEHPSTEIRATKDSPAENGHFLSASYRADRSRMMSRRASSPHAGPQFTPITQLTRPYNSVPNHPSRSHPIIHESNGAAAPAFPIEDDVVIMRTSSATDDRRASTHENLSGSRSMSPRRRRPFSESRLGPKRHRQDSPYDRLPVVQDPIYDRLPVRRDSLERFPSLAAKQQLPSSNAPDLHEIPGPNGHAHHHKHEHMQPGTQIIIYDFSEKQAYVAAYAQLKGMTYGVDYICQPLPKTGQQIEIGEKGSPIATVDLGSLGMITGIKRLAGSFPTLFVLNFFQKPG